MPYLGDLVGRPYRKGGRDGSWGLDCTGLAMIVYGRMGITLHDPLFSCWSEEFEPVEDLDSLEILSRPGLLLEFGTRDGFTTHLAVSVGAGIAIQAVRGKGVGVEAINAIRRDLTLLAIWEPRDANG